jgi:hypothetical protein
MTTRIFLGRLNKGPLKITVPTVGALRETVKRKMATHRCGWGTAHYTSLLHLF